MPAKSTTIFTIMKVFTFIFLIGISIKTGAMLISFFVSLFINPEAAKNLYMGLNLHRLLVFNMTHYISIVSLLLIISALQVTIALITFNTFLKLDLNNPFTETTGKQILKISYIALTTGLLALCAHGYTKVISKSGFAFSFNWGHAEFLFLAGVIFIIAQIFKRGIEIQSENELTV
ncbi:MAG: DUF2975 domain-containing protein [Ignavibacteriaceae bacterium]|nr:DUF2975 domain-containing protein [Ignavibacteriaceae bacterium]